MIKPSAHIVSLLGLLLLFQAGSAQIAAKAMVDRSQILIGEPVRLTLEATVSTGASAAWVLADSIPHFDVVDKGRMDTVQTADGISLQQQLIITSFDSGIRYIPPQMLVVDGKKYYTDSIPIVVSFTKLDPRQDYHDIKDILEVENPAVKYIIWVLLACTLLAMALTLYAGRRKEPVATEPQRTLVTTNPYEEAMSALENLRREKLPALGEIKLYYSRLNDILRLFILRQFQVASMEKTNQELILQLRQMNMPAAEFSRLAETLRMSDSVKFAKYMPEEPVNEDNMQVVESAIKRLYEIEQ